ncbi:MAG: FRG domain-containing protein [Lentisphaerae bacterium]|nr:FRG domain-containing protein [Lentisphaerota bacterium]
MTERPKTGTIKLHNWRDFTKVMKIMGDGRWIFRGHKSVSYHLDSGLDRYIADIVTAREKRGMKTDVKSFALTLPRAEHFAVANFRAKAHEFEGWTTNTSALLAMQHYGAKTRLLDFTTSIMVALFFAYEEKMTGEGRAIYAINYKMLIERSGWKGRYLKDAKRSDLMKRGDEEVWWEIESQIDNYYFHKFMLQLAEENINNGNGDKGMGIIPLYKARFNMRQMAQSGIELMPCTFDGFTKNLAAVFDVPIKDIDDPPEVRMGSVSKTPCEEILFPSSIIKFVFDPEMEDDAWRMLNQANINAATIYPDIDGIAKSVRYNDRILGLRERQNLCDLKDGKPR